MTNFASELHQKRITNSFLHAMRVIEYVLSVLMSKMMMMLIKKNMKMCDERA